MVTIKHKTNGRKTRLDYKVDLTLSGFSNNIYFDNKAFAFFVAQLLETFLEDYGDPQKSISITQIER